MTLMFFSLFAITVFFAYAACWQIKAVYYLHHMVGKKQLTNDCWCKL